MVENNILEGIFEIKMKGSIKKKYRRTEKRDPAVHPFVIGDFGHPRFVCFDGLIQSDVTFRFHGWVPQGRQTILFPVFRRLRVAEPARRRRFKIHSMPALRAEAYAHMHCATVVDCAHE